jgi:hypothetical protein
MTVPRARWGFNWGYSNYILHVNGVNVAPDQIFRVLDYSDFQSNILPDVIKVIQHDYPNYTIQK